MGPFPPLLHHPVQVVDDQCKTSNPQDSFDYFCEGIDHRGVLDEFPMQHEPFTQMVDFSNFLQIKRGEVKVVHHPRNAEFHPDTIAELVSVAILVTREELAYLVVEYPLSTSVYMGNQYVQVEIRGVLEPLRADRTLTVHHYAPFVLKDYSSGNRGPEMPLG